MTNINGTLKDVIKESEDNLETLSNFVMHCRSIFDRNSFPDNFDVWNINEQYKWIKGNIRSLFPELPEFYPNSLLAMWQVDRGQSLELPEWLDVDKYHRGQKFVHDYFFSIIICKILGLFHIYSLNDDLRKFIIAGQRSTPYLAFISYLSVIKRVTRWYNGEPWIKGTSAYENMRYVRRIHLIMGKKLCHLSNDELNVAVNAKLANPLCPYRELFLKDLAAAYPLEKVEKYPQNNTYKMSPYKSNEINNADLLLTQAGFISVLLLCPQYIGIHGASDEEIDAFCHMWRCYGYFLGIKDEFNFCRGSLDEIKQRTRDLYEYLIIPNFKDVTPQWEHMTRCLAESLNYYPILYAPYKVIVLFALDILGINMSHLYASFSYLEWIIYKIFIFILHHAVKFSSIRAGFNKLLQRSFDQAMRYDAKKLENLYQKSQKQLSDISTEIEIKQGEANR